MRFGPIPPHEHAELIAAVRNMPSIGGVLIKQTSDYASTSVPLGTRYRLYMPTRRTQRLGLDARTGKDAFCDMVWARREDDDATDPGGWIPIEFFRLEEN